MVFLGLTPFVTGGLVDAVAASPAAQVRWEKFFAITDRWFHNVDHLAQRAALATIAGLEVDDICPLWLMVVAPSSTGKSKVYVDMGHASPHAEGTGNQYLSGLVSAIGGKPKGKLLKHPVKMLWVMPELSNIIGRDERYIGDLLTAMRDLYDVKFSRSFRGLEYSHPGQVNFIGGGTDHFDLARGLHRELGERLMVIRPSLDYSLNSSLKAAGQGGREQLVKEELKRAAAEIVTQALPRVSVPGWMEAPIHSLALLVGVMRCGVQRDPRTHEIVDVMDPEGPHRLFSQFIGLAKADAAVHGLREAGQEQYRLVYRVAMDTIAKRRGQIIQVWRTDPALTLRRVDVFEASGIDWATSFAYALKDMVALGFITESHDAARNETTLRLSDQISSFLANAKPPTR